MFSKKKEERPKREPRDRNLSQYGLFDMPSNLSFDDPTVVNDNDDDDLEAELLALTSGQGVTPSSKTKRRPAPVANLDSLIADSIRDIPSDEELSGDDDDPDLLNELNEIVHDEPKEEDVVPPPKQEDTDLVTVLQRRLEMYVLAEQNAKKSGEVSRARRFSRGIKTLKDLIKQTNAGKAIDPEEIPPEVSTGVNQKPAQPQPQNDIAPTRTAPQIPTYDPEKPQIDMEQPEIPTVEPEKALVEPTNNDRELETLNMLKKRCNEYKIAAVKAKKSGDTQSAIGYMKIGKQFDLVIRAIENNEQVDLSNMPGPPEDFHPSTSQVETKKTENETQKNESEATVEEEEELINPRNMLEGLQLRMKIYLEQEQKAKEEGNGGKARRMGRIVKQYEQAIKCQKTGKPIPLDELPNPPGFTPLILQPVEQKEDDSSSKIPENPHQDEKMDSTPTSEPEQNQTSARRIAPNIPTSHSVRKKGNKSSTTTNEKQMNVLLVRQREFKEAALEAKKKGEMAQAKEYLRTAKGFEKVIEAAKCGLPVDMESLPIPPNARSQIDDSYEVVLADECTEDDSGMLDMLTRLEEQLTKQLKICLSTRDHHKAIGDVAGMNRFEHLALSVTRDLDIVRLAHRTNSAEIPKFHYENKSFSVVKCCTDLSDNDFELTIIRGINYNCTNPKDVDTYVKFEFPYPQEETVKDRTPTMKDTNNPEYNATFTLPIQRTARPCLRVFKRQAVKLEIYSKGGFFRGDSLLGSVNIKLQPLETQCELHDSYDLMDGRKKVGGKLEVRMRVRNPLVAKQIEQMNEKWLVINH